MSTALREVYEESSLNISFEAFENAVAEKEAEYGELVDTETAATLALEELESLQDRAADIGELTGGNDTVSVIAKVVSLKPEHTFERDNGDSGTVRNVELADASGRIRGAFWDDNTNLLTDISQMDTVLIDNATVRANDGDIELHSTRHTELEQVEKDIQVSFTTKSVAEVEIGDICNLKGAITYVGEIEEFEKDDGSTGEVQHITVDDGDNSIRASLWGTHTSANLECGDRALLLDAEIREGIEGDQEASVGWYSTLLTRKTEDSGQSNTDSQSPPGDNDATDDNGTDRGSGSEDVSEEPDECEVTGRVIGRDDGVVLDADQGELTVKTDEDVNLGSTITVRGTMTGQTIDAEEVI